MKGLKWLALGAGAIGVGLGFIFHDEIEEFIDGVVDKFDDCGCGCKDCQCEHDEWDDDFEDLDLEDEIDLETGLHKCEDNCFEDTCDVHENVIDDVSYDEDAPTKYVTID